MTPTFSGIKAMLSYKQAADKVGLSENTFRKMFEKQRKNKLPHYKIGRRYFFKQEDIEQWLEQFRVSNSVQ